MTTFDRAGPGIASVALNEVLVHGWDLAVATGQPYRADDDAAQRCLDVARQFADAAPEARGGARRPDHSSPGVGESVDRVGAVPDAARRDGGAPSTADGGGAA